MGTPEQAIDVAKRMLDPFLDPKTTEKLFDGVVKLLQDINGTASESDEINALSILLDVVEGVREYWQQKQKRVEHVSTRKMCTASASITQYMPGMLQISMACQGTADQVHNEMLTQSVLAIKKVVEEYQLPLQGGSLSAEQQS